MDILNMLPRRYYGVNNAQILLTNLSANVNISEQTKTQTQLFLDYRIESNESARSISERLYGDASFYWTIFVVNGIVNVVEDYPRVNFEDYVRTIYTPDQLSEIIGYSDVDRNLTDIQAVRFLNGLEDSVNVTDQDIITMFNLKPITMYEVLEMEENKKRNIKLIDPDYIEQFSDAIYEALK